MTDDKRLTATKCAWLLHVNDDTVRKWFRDPEYPGYDAGTPLRSTSWADLDRWCERTGRARPLPAKLLDVSQAEATALLSRVPTAAAPDHDAAETEATNSVVDPEDHSTDALRLVVMERDEARREAATLRRALRERLAGASHARADAAAADRALNEFLDAAEERARPHRSD